MRTAKLEEILTEGESTQTSTEGRYRGEGFVVEGKCYKYCHQQKVDIEGTDLLLRANVTDTVVFNY